MHTRKQDYYFNLIAQWQGSAMNQKDFCAHYELKRSTFRYWIGKYRKADASTSNGFVPREQTHTEIIYPNGVRISVSVTDPASIAQREEQVRLFKRLIFGAKRERFASDCRQMALPFELTQAQKTWAEAEHTERIAYTRRKASAGSVRYPFWMN